MFLLCSVDLRLGRRLAGGRERRPLFDIVYQSAKTAAPKQRGIRRYSRARTLGSMRQVCFARREHLGEAQTRGRLAILSVLCVSAVNRDRTPPRWTERPVPAGHGVGR